MGDRMRAAGYVNGWFGKSHLGYKPEYHPLKRGFDEYFGFVGGAHDYFDAKGTDRHNPPSCAARRRVNAIGYTTEDFAEETVKFIRKHKEEPSVRLPGTQRRPRAARSAGKIHEPVRQYRGQKAPYLRGHVVGDG